MSSSSSSGPTRALADFAFGSHSRIADTSRPLAWLSPEELAIDLADPVQRRFGDYELIEKIGQGGMGVVYRALQHGLQRDVAFKLLAAGPWASDEFVERFRREARSAARMQHPNIVEIYEFGHRDGLNYFSMRLVEGQSLAERLAATGPLAPIEAARLLRTLAEAMDYAHRLGVLHLDLKPGNVLLTPVGEPLIADFGLARRIDAGHEGGEIAGTPSYMAPEQALLESHPLSASTDIWGLGAILYECLTGRPPFLAPDAQRTLQRVVGEAPQSPSSLDRSIPADLDAICLKCLEKDPAQRYASARALAEDLHRFVEGRAVSVRPLSLSQRALRWLRREPGLAIATTCALAILVLGAITATVLWRQAEAARAVADEHSDRSRRFADLIAHSFPVPQDEETARAIERSAVRIVSWLERELGERPELQRILVFDLIGSLDRADNPGAAQALMQPVVTQLGRSYLISAAESHIASGTQRGKLLGALLMERAELAPDDRARQQALLAEVVTEAPQDLDTLVAALYYCNHVASDCAALEPAQRLAQLWPDNAANWIFAMRSEDSTASQDEHIARAAAATVFDDHFNRVMRLNIEAIQSAVVPVPELLFTIARTLTPEASVAETIAHLHAYYLPLPAWQPLAGACRPDRAELRDARRRDHCLAVGRKAAFEGQSLIANMVGSAVVRHMRPGSEEEHRARELRRHYMYVTSARHARSPEQVRASRDGLVVRDMAELTEIEAYKRTLDRTGLPRDPPPDWMPENPEALMTGLEREVFRQRQSELAKESLVPEWQP
jgi:hypothetical protein